MLFESYDFKQTQSSYCQTKSIALISAEQTVDWLYFPVTALNTNMEKKKDAETFFKSEGK